MTENTGMAALTHILALFTWFIGPLIMLIATEDEFVEENARNAINFQIVFTLGMFISGILSLVLIGLLLMPILGLLDLIFCVMAAVKASDGEAWEYPLTPDLV